MSSTWEPFSACFLPSECRQPLPIRIILVFCEQTDISSSVCFPHPSFNRTSSNCRSHNSPAKGWPYRFSLKRNDWVFHTGPWFRPYVSWKAYPYVWTYWLRNFEQSWTILQFYLGVCWYRICCLSFTIRQFCSYIRDLCRSHLGRGRALLCENSTSACTLKFLFHLRIFRVTCVHQWSKVDFSFVSLCLQDHLFFFASNFFQFPGCNRFELFPFFVHCSFRIWIFLSLSASGSTCQPNCNDSLMFFLGLQCDLHECLGWDSSVLGLVDSWDSTIQPHLVLGTFGDAINSRSRFQKPSLFIFYKA